MNRVDYLLAAIVLVVVASAYVIFWGGYLRGDYAVIKVAGKEYETVALSQNIELKVEGALGLSILQIDDGRIRFDHSPCQAKQCIHSGWAEKTGEVLACLPNRVTVAIEGMESHFDSINF